MEGTLIRWQVEHLPAQRAAKPSWLGTSTPEADTADVLRCGQACRRRFDLDHTIRLRPQTLGWTAPKIRSPQAVDRWTWLVLAAHPQLRLARPRARDLRRAGEKSLAPERLTPARVRRGFRYLRAKSTQPARAPKPTHPGPGRPPGTPNQRRAARYDIGKTVIRDTASSSDCTGKG